MSNLSNILNPEGHRNKSTNAPNPEESTATSSGDKEKQVASMEKPSSYKPYEHEPHPDCPDTLACLPDTDGRPQHTLPVILRCSILGSPRKRLTIREIYQAMEEKYPYYKTAGPTWKQSVRHHLSLNRLFERQPRPVTDPGFGSYWTVNLSAPPGTKRPRKRGRTNKDARAGSEEQGSTKSSAHDATPIASTSTSPAKDGTSQASKRRGRPRKASSATQNRDITPVSSSHVDDEDGDHEMDDDAPPDSDEERNSRDDVFKPSPFDRRESLGALGLAYDHGHSYDGLPPRNHQRADSPEPTVERLQEKNEVMRRDWTVAVSNSLRLGEQLAQAQAEIHRQRTIIQDLQETLEDEQSRRREAERIANEEVKRRHHLEESFSAGASTRPQV